MRSTAPAATTAANTATTATAFVVLAAVLSALLFGPVFGVLPLILPLVIPAGLVLGLAVLCSRRPGLVPWRPVLTTIAGVLAIIEILLPQTTMIGLPTGDTLRALSAGVTESWRIALQSTWPAQPEPEVMLFTPLLSVVACVLGVELLHRVGALPALLPSFAVVVLSQFFSAAHGFPAVLGAFAYAAAAGALLAVTRPDRVTDDRRRASAWLTGAPAVVLAVVAALVGGLLVPSAQPRYTLAHNEYPPLAPASVTSPLDQIGAQLEDAGQELFTVDGGEGVNHWPLVVLNSFDGVNWRPGNHYRRLGAEMPPNPEVTVAVERRTAVLTDVQLDGPWLPSQTMPAGVEGPELLVEEGQGTLLLPTPAESGQQPLSYTLSWWEPQVDPDALYGAGIDNDEARRIPAVPEVPAGITELATEAVPGRPTFQNALVLERFLRDNYRLVGSQNLPGGHSWPQLTEFLLGSKRGTSEQFAAAYVILAQIKGIPARLVVGYRAPADRAPGRPYTVHSGDVLAWPEVAVEGYGWVPLDPTGSATTVEGGPQLRGLVAAAAEQRQKLPPGGSLEDPKVAPDPDDPTAGSDDGWAFPFWTLPAVPLLAAALWLAGIPLAKLWRARRRRRRPGAGAVIGAWEEARDRLRAYGVPVSAGMTVRDLTTAIKSETDGAAVEALRSLAATVDFALWSGLQPSPDAGRRAWVSVREVRRGMAQRGWRASLRAALNPRPLRRPR